MPDNPERYSTLYSKGLDGGSDGGVLPLFSFASALGMIQPDRGFPAYHLKIKWIPGSSRAHHTWKIRYDATNEESGDAAHIHTFSATTTLTSFSCGVSAFLIILNC